MTAMVDDGDDDDEETARYFLVGPDGDDGDGLWRGVLLVIGSWFNNQLVVFIIYRYPV
jgi:hypothetical protein